MKFVKNRIWEWPDGLAWRLTEGLTLKSRRSKYGLFLSLAKPGPESRILDVGVAPYSRRGTNFLEQWYPFPNKITALASAEEEGEFNDFSRHFSRVKLVFGDGTKLMFPDDSFDIVFSNAVVEHVGNRAKQRQFIGEICRVGRRVFVTTPNYWFPVDAHTLIPFVHWFHERPRFWVYRKARRDYWADPERLNLLSAKTLASLFPETVALRIFRQRALGMTTSLIALAEKT